MFLLTIFVEHGIIARIPGVAKPMKTLELHNPMVQFFIIEIIPPAQVNLFCARFSTKDNDNDTGGGNCSKQFKGALTRPI